MRSDIFGRESNTLIPTLDFNRSWVKFSPCWKSFDEWLRFSFIFVGDTGNDTFNNNQIQLFVRTWRGQTNVYQVDQNATIQDLKDEIQVRELCPTALQRIHFSGKPVDSDSSALVDYGITNESTLHVDLRLIGGMPRHGRQDERRRQRRRLQREHEEIEKEDGTEYGWVVTSLGNRRILVKCNDGISRQCIIRYKPGWCRQYINVGDLILIGIRDFAEETGDVLHKYSYEQAKKLVALGKVRRAPDSEVEKVLLLPTDGGLETDDDLDFIFEDI